MPDNKRKLVSIVIPALDEEDNLDRVYDELTDTLTPLTYDFEFIVIDNASRDKTGEICAAICARDRRWSYVRFSRNFTVEMSITAGYRLARGDAVIVLYSDLQDPPQVIPRFLEKWEQGFDVVYGIRTVRPGDSAWRNLAVRVAYRLIHLMADVPIPENAGDFRLLSRAAVQALNRCDERNRYLRGLIAWLGFPQTEVHYERQPRIGGHSKAPFYEVLFFFFGALTSFSMKPLRLFTAAGFLILCASTLAIPYHVIGWLSGSPPPGITTVIILLLVMIGVNSLGIGILGEYLGRTYLEAKRRPLFIVEKAINADLTQLSRLE